MDRYLDSITEDAAGFAGIVRAHPLDTPVPSCPGWDLRALAGHLGWVHRWARLSAVTCAPPVEAEIDDPPADQQELADWISAGAAALVDALAGIPADAPTWHPFPAPRIAAVWPRRQAHELAIHRWDAGAAVGQPSSIDSERAADFIGEYLEVVVPRVVARDGRLAPEGDLRIVLTDASAEYGVRVTGPQVAVIPAADLVNPSVISGDAQDVLLALWRRAPLGAPPADARAAAWLDFGGN